MGLTDYPYHACQDVTWSRKIYLGNRLVPSNPFKWYRVVVNFPGSLGYYCKRP